MSSSENRQSMEKAGSIHPSQAEGSQASEAPPDYLPRPEEFGLDDFALPRLDAPPLQEQPPVGAPADSQPATEDHPFNFFKPRRELTKRHWWILLGLLIALIVIIPTAAVLAAHTASQVKVSTSQNTTFFMTETMTQSAIQSTTLLTTFSTTGSTTLSATLLSATILITTDFQSTTDSQIIVVTLPITLSETTTQITTQTQSTTQIENVTQTLISTQPTTIIQSLTQPTTIISTVQETVVSISVSVQPTTTVSLSTVTQTQTNTPSSIPSASISGCWGLVQQICAGTAGFTAPEFADCEVLYQYFYCGLITQLQHHYAGIIPGDAICVAMQGFCSGVPLPAIGTAPAK